MDITSLELSTNLYRGAFLEGFSLPSCAEFEQWIVQQRYSLERLYLLGLEALIEQSIEQGNLASAIRYAQRYLNTDPLAEDVHRRLIELYAATGNRNAAMRQFELCTHALEQELGVSPLPETRAAYQDILENRISLRQPVKPIWKPSIGEIVPLVGRSQAMKWLEDVVRAPGGGNEKVILISGEAGIGKSRLLQEFIARLSADTAVVMGSAYPETQTLPYYPLIQALQSLCNPMADNAAAPLLHWLPRSLDQVWLVEVSRVLPDLRRLFPNLPLPLPAASEEARSRLFEALVQFMIGLCTSPAFLRSHSSLILCLENLHWADSTTLDWLVHLGRQIHGNPLLIVGTYRSEEADTLLQLRRDLHSFRALSELHLTGLDTSAILQILNHFTVSPTTDMHELAEHLQSATGGNPFFLLEILKVMFERGWLSEKWGTGMKIPLPDTIRKVIEARIQRLSSVARQVLEAGAIAGPVFTFELVRGIAGRREMEVVSGLDELVDCKLLMEQGSTYRFHHELVERAVYDSLSPVRRQLLHRRAGWTLTRLNPEEAVSLARHFDLGGETRQALICYERAVQQAEALFSWKEADQHLNRMLALLDKLDPHENQPDYIMRRGLILLKRAHHHYLQGKITDRDAALKTVILLAEKHPEKTLTLLTLLDEVRYLNLGGKYEKAIALAKAAIRNLPMDDLPSPAKSTLALLFAEIAFAHYFLGQPDEGFSALYSAKNVAGPNPGPKVQGHIEHQLSYLFLHQGNYAEALIHQQEALQCHQTCQDFNAIAWAELDLGFLYMKLGRFFESKTHLEQSLQLARRISAKPAEIYALTYSGYRNLYLGNYSSAIETFQQTFPLHQALLQEHGVVAVEIGWGLALHQLGETFKARIRFQNAVDRSRRVFHRRRLAEALVGLGLVELDDLHPESAQVVLNEAVQLARLCKCAENLAAGFAALARAERETGNSLSAMVRCDEARSVAQQFALPACEIWAEIETGLTYLAQEKQDSALEHTSRAIQLIPQAYESWIQFEEVYGTHAKVLQALGQVEDAHPFLQKARSLIEKKSENIYDPSQRERYLSQKLTRFSL